MIQLGNFDIFQCKDSCFPFQLLCFLPTYGHKHLTSILHYSHFYILDINHVLATTLEIVDGKVAGGVMPCFGEGKYTAALNFAQQSGANLQQAYFYSDSYDDLPLLDQVGHPVVVNGKPKLSKVGRENGWVSLQFVETGRDYFEPLARRAA